MFGLMMELHRWNGRNLIIGGGLRRNYGDATTPVWHWRRNLHQRKRAKDRNGEKTTYLGDLDVMAEGADTWGLGVVPPAKGTVQMIINPVDM